MRTVTQLIYAAAGAPPIPGGGTGACRTCGGDGIGEPFGRWVKDTFTDHASLHPGNIVCHACLLLFQNLSPFYQALLARDKPQKPWNWSHFVAGGRYVVLSKGDKAQMRSLLLESPEVAVIAESGQKHLAFRALPGVWQFELQRVPPDVDRLSWLLHRTDALYVAGATKAEVQSGHYSAGSLARIGAATWRALDLDLRPHRGTPLFEMACFLTLKPETTDERPAGPDTASGATAQYGLL